MLFQQNKYYQKQQGVVIVVALFIVALVATLATTMMVRLERDTRRTMLILRDTQAEHYAQASVFWAMDQLKNNWEKKKTNQLVDVTPIHSPVRHEQDYEIISTIYDMQARYNLNNLTTKESELDFQKLLKLIKNDLIEEQVKTLTHAISVSVIQNSFQSTTELRLVKGMTADIYQRLKPYVVALPGTTEMNVVNAEAPVLITLSPQMTEESAKIVEQLCKARAPVTVDAFLNWAVIRNHHVDAAKITLTSAYFLVETQVTIEKQHIVLYTLLQRVSSDKDAKVNILWQSKGTW